MAKCEKREIKPALPPVEYVLTLSEDEARELRIILFYEGDDYDTSSILAALKGAMSS